MDSHVTLPMTVMPKRFITDFTFKRFTACVHNTMRIMTALRGKRFTTNFTLPRLFTCVNPHVRLQLGIGYTFVATHTARKLLFTVEQHMAAESFRAVELFFTNAT